MPEAVVGKARSASNQEEPADDLTTRLLDAARDHFARFGVRRSSIDDIAKLAQVGRATVFRRFGTKDELLYAVMHRELRTLMAELDAIAAASRELSVSQRVARAFAVTVMRARTNPLLGGPLGAPSADMLELTAIDAAQLMGVAANYISDQLRRDQDRGELPSDIDVTRVAEVAVRTLHSIALVPKVQLRLDTEEELYAFALHGLGPLLRSGSGSGH